jgi:hypothetical protein
LTVDCYTLTIGGDTSTIETPFVVNDYTLTSIDNTLMVDSCTLTVGGSTQMVGDGILQLAMTPWRLVAAP